MSISRALLKEVVQDQAARFKAAERGVRREILSELEGHFSSPQVVVLSGLRRAGKSTVLAQLSDELSSDSFYYLNFEDERLSSFRLEDFGTLAEAFIESFGTRRVYLFDEIQEVEGWEKFVRRKSDQGDKFFVTGSNASLLSKEFGTKLTGRASYIEIFPFSFTEFLAIEEISLPTTVSDQARVESRKIILSYLERGGVPLSLAYPELEVLRDLYQDILFRDVVVRYGLDSAKPIRDLLNFVVSNPSTLQSFSKLKQLVQVGSITTIKKYVDYLESAWLLFSLNIYDLSVKRQQLQPKKIIPIDTGFVRMLAADWPTKLSRVFETAIFLALRRRHREIFYYITKSAREIDFYIPKENLFVQVCLDLSDADTLERELSGAAAALGEIRGSRALIVYLEGGEYIESPDERIRIVGAVDFLVE